MLLKKAMKKAIAEKKPKEFQAIEDDRTSK